MPRSQKVLLAAGTALLLFIISYRYSLYHATSMLPYLTSPQTVPPFTKIITYLFMMIGLPPTILMILYTTFLCHTTLYNWAIQIVCFGAPFSLSNNEGLFAYIVASIISAGVVFIFLQVFTKK